MLGAPPSELTAARLGGGLTPEMAAAVAKLCSNLDLVAGAARIPVVTRANTTLGLPGRLGVRLQPNHPTDDVAEILAQTAEGLSFGCGDALIGVNPARDDEEVVRRLLLALDALVRKHRVPTQTCVLAHVTTQMRVLDGGPARGAEPVPMGLMFQSLAGTQSACRAFGIDVALLDEAAAMARECCNVAGPNVMYFETGQGSELSSGCHEGIDQVTLEARCYGLARRYAPFLVNTVVGFIGPEYLYDASEVQRAGLEDHFMGKLLGLPMGVDACATNHMRGDHDDLENQALLLAAAGANYFMGVPMGDDVLLGYRSTSFHDAAALRETLGRRPAPEFERWMERQGLMR
ncbi:MAG TPA: ethanolamine ammonia-lyase subunit EutB, partial [Planctomycetota bacterium]|nr:ethanolamine ammonia-lyase subunit EutB [Planctomycetota bacterium]